MQKAKFEVSSGIRKKFKFKPRVLEPENQKSVDEKKRMNRS